jgi:Short C-terminal domain
MNYHDFLIRFNSSRYAQTKRKLPHKIKIKIRKKHLKQLWRKMQVFGLFSKKENKSKETIALGSMGYFPHINIELDEGRIVFIKSLTQYEVFRLKDITNITLEMKGLLKGHQINIFAGGTIASSFEVPYSKKLTETIEMILEHAEKERKVNQNSTNSIDQDPYSHLEKLYALKEKGIITEEEFMARKKVLLAS